MQDSADTRHVQVNFRMPVRLKDQLRESADRGNRSLSSEVVHRLELSLLFEMSERNERIERSAQALARMSWANETRDEVKRGLIELEGRLRDEADQVSRLLTLLADVE